MRIFAAMDRKHLISVSQWVKFGLISGLALFIYVFSQFPEQVENWYSAGIYPELASTLRIITKWIPFSIGDILYVALGCWLLLRLGKAIITVVKGKLTRERVFRFLFTTVKLILWIYIIFKLIWGLNYSRQGIAHQLAISRHSYTKQEVTDITNQLIDKVNMYRRQIKDTSLPVKPLDSIYREAYRAYQNASYTLEFMNYRNRSVKSSLFTRLGDYMGFSGYYNPFTGEAQLRTDIPAILIPFIATHEMAHQLGYASESEANFVGYLAASASTDPYFLYSVYLDLFSYAQGEEIALYVKDKDFTQFEQVVRQNRERLDTLVKSDRRAIREFFRKRRNRVSPAVSNLYDQYLKMNKQMQGVNSYNEVIGWLIAYQKKYGKI